MRLKTKELNKLRRHYEGNCVNCARCAFYEDIERGKPGAVEAYVTYMKEHEGVTVQTVAK